MIRSFTILTLCLLLTGYCCAQGGGTKSTKKTTGTKSQTTKSRKQITSTKKQGTTTRGAAQAEPVEVLFATNEDGELFINGQPKGEVKKSDFTYLKLVPGTHRYTIKNKLTADTLSESFTVSKDAANEVFIDLLYFIDEKNAEREALARNREALDNGLTLVAQKQEGSSPEEEKKLQEAKAMNGVINFFLYNMVLVNDGKFVMGNNRSPFPDEAEHTVSLKPFYFSKFEVTQNQWQIIMGYNPSINKGCDLCPVENVSWEEVMVFIRKINAISGKRFRLPTEAEWEYVARLGGREEIENAGGPEEYVKKTAWHFQNAEGRTHPIGTRQPSAAGVYDLMGNVSEWCSDWYGAYFYKEDYTDINPEGPPLGKEKVYRGGNFKDSSGDRFRPSLRNKKNPLGKGGELGFRLVLDQKGEQ